MFFGRKLTCVLLSRNLVSAFLGGSHDSYNYSTVQTDLDRYLFASIFCLYLLVVDANKHMCCIGVLEEPSYGSDRSSQKGHGNRHDSPLDTVVIPAHKCNTHEQA